MVKIDKRIFWPKLLAQLVPSNQFAWVLEKDAKDLQRLAVQRNLDPILPQFTGLWVRFKDSKSDNLRSWAIVHGKNRRSHRTLAL